MRGLGLDHRHQCMLAKGQQRWERKRLRVPLSVWLQTKTKEDMPRLHACLCGSHRDSLRMWQVSKANRYTGVIPAPSGIPPAALPGYNADNWTLVRTPAADPVLDADNTLQVDAPHDMLLDQPVEFGNNQAQVRNSRD